MLLNNNSAPFQMKNRRRKHEEKMKCKKGFVLAQLIQKTELIISKRKRF